MIKFIITIQVISMENIIKNNFFFSEKNMIFWVFINCFVSYLT